MSARELFDFDFGLQEEVEVGLAESPPSQTFIMSQPIVTVHRSNSRVPVGIALAKNPTRDPDCVEIEVRNV